MPQPHATGYAPIDGLEIYWERFGSAGQPLVVIHGGFGVIPTLAALIDALSAHRQIVALELQGHGHTRDIDRPFSYEAFGDDIAGVIEHLGLGPADLLGYSLGGGSSLRAAIQHPDLIRKLVVVSFPARRDGWLPEVRTAFDQMGRSAFAAMRHSPLYEGYARVAPDPDAFPALIDKTGELQRRPFDWSDEIRDLPTETMLVYADADSISAAHIAEFYALLGGGLRDAGWDGSARADARLAVLPGRTHYDIAGAPSLIDAVNRFLG
jgi:pimeloyl-ACP methyl ester carboxylesterase